MLCSKMKMIGRYLLRRRVFRCKDLERDKLDSLLSRAFSTKLPGADDPKNVWKMLKEELTAVKDMRVMPLHPELLRESDAVIIGGGIMGNAAAYWLKQRNPKGFTCTVIEQDPTYKHSSTMLSLGGVRHQFSLPENVQMSLFASEFLRNIEQHLSVKDMPAPDVKFNPQGYLFLGTDKTADLLEDNVKMQQELGAQVKLFSKSQLAEKFPWLSLDGIVAGSYGIEGEGWFDPWCLVQALKLKNKSLGVQYATGEVVGFETNAVRLNGPDGLEDMKKLHSVLVKLPSGNLQPVKFCFCINCAGAWAGQVAKMAGIGDANQHRNLADPLPVVPRKRYVYMIHCPEGPGLHTPFLVDSTGVYVRREGLGGHYLTGMSPNPDEEPDIDQMDIDYAFYEEQVWPLLANRIPQFENSKLISAWSGFYDWNTMDQNAIIGRHPYHNNFFFMNGFSGHGLQQALAAGRGMMELLIDGEYSTIDLSKFSFDRVVTEEPVYEAGIV